MTLLKWEPRRDIEVAQKRLSQFFNDFESAVTSPLHFEWGNYAPRVDISEDKDNLYFIAELPGMSEEDVKVTVSEGTLTIRGEKKREQKHEERNFFRMERSIALPPTTRRTPSRKRSASSIARYSGWSAWKRRSLWRSTDSFGPGSSAFRR